MDTTFADYLTVEEVAQALHLHPEYVRELARKEKIPGRRKVLHRWLFDKEQVQAWIAHGRRELA